ncbi:MAG TPA: MBL fold metallo-hydrolase [Acetobacteraceae bacterium]|nr:MBL fold metallo-hydrolase [Acetobacteraceae bacterium]
MRVILLGTGGSTGVPTLGGADGKGDWGACNPEDARNRRTRSSIVIEGQGGRVLVDTGPDMRAQLLACGVPRIDAIIFTHAHADHITGLDDVRLLNRIAGKALPAFATETTFAELRRRFDYVFKPWEPPVFYRPVLDTHVITPGQTIEAAGFSISSFDQDHHVMHTLGLRVGGFAYSTDLVRLNEAAFAALQGVDTWLVSCFQRAPHMTHAHLELVLAWRARLGVRRTVLTHMGIDMDFAWLAAHLPAGVEPGVDGQVLEIVE